MTDDNQAMVAQYRYDPFGIANNAGGSLADANVYRFSSKELHAASGMYYYGYRFYDPALQRWSATDAIGEQEGVNLYRFTSNDPIDNIDDSGLQVLTPPIRPPSPAPPAPPPLKPKPPLPKPPVFRPPAPVRPRPFPILGPLCIFIGEVLDPPSLAPDPPFPCHKSGEDEKAC